MRQIIYLTIAVILTILAIELGDIAEEAAILLGVIMGFSAITIANET